MSKSKTLQDLFFDTLKDFAEKKILSALPKMAKAAHSDELRAAFEKHHLYSDMISARQRDHNGGRPKLVDWTFAMRGRAALDLGFLHIILSELAPEIADNPERPRATNAAAQSEYARLTGADGGNGAVFAHRPHLRADFYVFRRNGLFAFISELFACEPELAGGL